MSIFCVALCAFIFCISFKIYSLSTNKTLKRVLELQFSLIAIMLGWVLYLIITLITGSLMEADIRSDSLHYEIFRYWKIVEKKFKTWAVSLSFLKMLVLSTSAIFSLDIILLDSIGLTTFQNFLLSHTFSALRFWEYSLLFFLKSVIHKFLCLL